MTQLANIKNAVAKKEVRPMSPEVARLRKRSNLMAEALKTCMIEDVHYGKIAGMNKPCLYKAGAEKVMTIFHLSANPIVEDLSKDGEIRFRVKVEIKSKDGFEGAGIGECSSGEEKYSWRKAVCDKEWEATSETERRIKFKSSYGKVEEIAQVRVHPLDVANTILKMAKKRALVDGVLTATGASDIFAQDIEDLPEEFVETVKSSDDDKKVDIKAEATEAEIVETKTTTVEELIGAKPIKTFPLCEAVVVKIDNRQTSKGQNIAVYTVEGENGEQAVIEAWGSPLGDCDGVLCRFYNVKVTEFKGKKQFFANKVEVCL